MSIAFARKIIYCPNCDYEGKAKIKGTGGGPALFGLISIVVGIIFWPLLIVGIFLFIIAIFRPADQICPKCKWSHPAPLGKKNKICGSCGQKNRWEDYTCINCGNPI